VFRHYNEGVNLKSTFTAVSIERFEKDAHVVLDDEEASALPGRESYEVRSGRGDESSRLQEQTSAAKAAIFA